jgi:hypothetical protein
VSAYAGNTYDLVASINLQTYHTNYTSYDANVELTFMILRNSSAKPAMQTDNPYLSIDP